ncbi:MAG: GntR family transcriptional regulator, partial [Oxalobacteraceae bacterium]
MSPSHVLEPTYASIRHCLVSGFWPAGRRLEAARLAEELGVSITPVRDSL